MRSWPPATGTSSTCLANQALHGQSEALDGLVGPQLVAPGTGPGRDPSLFDRRSMSDWAQHMIVPVFLSGALQDEQTGPQWPPLIDAIPKTDPRLRQHGQRRPHRFDRSADHQPLARVPRHLRRRPGPDPAGRHDAIVARPVRRISVERPVAEVAPLPPTRFTTRRTCPWPATSSKPRPRGSGSSSTAGPARSVPGASSRRTPPASPSGRRRAPSPRALRTGRRDGLAEAGAQGQRHLHPDPTSARYQPASRRESLGGPTRLGLDSGPAADGIAFQTARSPSDHDCRSGHRRALGQVGRPGRGLPGHRHRGPRPANQEEYVTSGFLRSDDQADLPDSTALFTDPTYLGPASGTSRRSTTPW